MTTAPVYRPFPLGELLEQLRLDGFVVTPDVYDRCFTVTNVYFPEGLNPETGRSQQLQVLKEMLGPVVSRSDLEQEKFGAVFDRVMRESEDKTGQLSHDITLSNPKKPLLLKRWILAGIGLLLVLLAGKFLYDEWQKPADGPEETTQKPGETTQNQPINPTDPRCDLTIRVQSIEGNTITFENRSPGRNQGIRYSWVFSDGRSVTTYRESTVSHTFKTLGNQASVAITAQSKTCEKSVRLGNFRRNDTPQTPGFPLLEAPAVLRTIYTLNPLALALAVLLSMLALGVVLFRYLFPRRTIKPADGPPYFLTFPDQEKGIKVADSMDVWARQLNQRDESQRLIIYLARSIRATVRAGGYPVIFYHAIKSRPRYLVLIDNRSTFHQQARLYAYLSKVLSDSEVELETLFFNADPRSCWSEKYPKGIAIEDLYRLHRNSYLVLITDGTRLIDYDNNAVTSWVARLFEGWEKRAILTPVYPENWTYIEKILTRFFLVLPATPDGQLLLRDYFQADELPTFQELRRRFSGQNGQQPDRGFFGLSVDALTIGEVDQFLDTSFQAEITDETAKTALKQWAYATAVYPTPTWEMTLAIGKAIESYYQTGTLVTTTNLLKITALPWLQQRETPSRLRHDLLEKFSELPPTLKDRIQTEILNLLHAVQTRPGSLADEEREMHTYEVWLTDENRKSEALRKLEPFQKAGLLTNPAIAQEIRVDRVRKQGIFVSALAVVAVLLFLIGYWGLPTETGTPVAVPGSLLYTSQSTLDSAVIYNNLAASATPQNLEDTTFRAKTERLAFAIGYVPGSVPYLDFEEAVSATDAMNLESREKERYTLRLAFLMASLRRRVTFEAMYNLHALRYEYGRYQDSVPNRNPANVALAISPLKEIDKIIGPTIWFKKNNSIPQQDSLENYLLLLQHLQIDTTANYVKYGIILQNGNIQHTSVQEMSQAKQAAQFNRINLYLPTTDRENVLRVQLPRLNLSVDRLNSLSRIDAARIKLYVKDLLQRAYEEPTVSISPNSATTQPPSTTVSQKPANKQPSRKVPAKNRPRSGDSKTPPQSKPDYEPSTPDPKQQSLPTTTAPATNEPAATVQQQTTLSNEPLQPAGSKVGTDPQSTSQPQQTQAPVEQRGIPGEYGVLVGTLTQSRVVNGDLYLIVRANKDEYRVRIDNQQTNTPSDQPIIAIADGNAVQKIPGFQKFRTANEGFYPLEKNRAAGALDYLRTDDSYNDFKVVNKMGISELTKLLLFVRQLDLSEINFFELLKDIVSGIWAQVRAYFTTASPTENRAIFPENLLDELRISEKSQPRILVWGGRWQPGTDDTVFKLRNGFNEIRYVHLNQGSYAPNNAYNAPWQDGGFIIDSGTPRAVAIRFSSQSTTVDDNGDPIRPATAK